MGSSEDRAQAAGSKSGIWSQRKWVCSPPHAAEGGDCGGGCGLPVQHCSEQQPAGTPHTGVFKQNIFTPCCDVLSAEF